MRNKLNILFGLIFIILIICLISYLITTNVIKSHLINIQSLKENLSKTDIKEISPAPQEPIVLPGINGSNNGGSGSLKNSAQSSPPEPKILNNDVPAAEICPASLDISYLIDFAGTQNIFSDDTVYLGIRNNNQLPESINIVLDNANEGDLHIKGLGLSIMKSETLTNWWRGLFAPAQRKALLTLTPEACQPISSSLTITFPPSEGDYLD